MPYETSDFDPLMVRTITVYPYVSENSAGRRTYGSPRTVKCRIVDMVRTWRRKDGTERQSRALMYFSDNTVSINDKILLPAGYDPQEAEVIWFNRHDDDVGYHHTELTI